MPILKNLRSWVGGFDMTTDLNQVSLDLSRDEQDDTRFQPVGSGGARARLAGLKDVTVNLGGFHTGGTTGVDLNNFTAWTNGTEEVYSLSHDGVEGSPVYMLRGGRFKYSIGGPVGDNHKFTTDVMGSNGDDSVVRGLVTKTRATVSGTGATGTAQQLGAVAADQYLYAALHVFSVGTTITAVIESDNAVGFPSPVTQLTFGPITAIGGTMLRVAGPITDDYFRLRVSAITGSFSIAAAVAVDY